MTMTMLRDRAAPQLPPLTLLHLSPSPDPRAVEQAFVALTDAVLTLCQLSKALANPATQAEALPGEQLRDLANQAAEAMQQLRQFGLGTTNHATQLSQALTVLVLVAALLQSQPSSAPDPELLALLAFNTRRAKHNLCGMHALNVG